MPVEDVHLLIVQMLTTAYIYKEPMILYRDDITRAEIKVTVGGIHANVWKLYEEPWRRASSRDKKAPPSKS